MPAAIHRHSPTFLDARSFGCSRVTKAITKARGHSSRLVVVQFDSLSLWEGIYIVVNCTSTARLVRFAFCRLLDKMR